MFAKYYMCHGTLYEDPKGERATRYVLQERKLWVWHSLPRYILFSASSYFQIFKGRVTRQEAAGEVRLSLESRRCK
jgi:hypothetical protein